ncbi:hypothetical protein Tsubulata_006168 [Turnera subulata]|uniref:Uncharacterized protein n=1 Tax=Turnera subulata TaxID=218843 RepID=A0A9Q0JCN6_9ROSI|nr:hypothetical protein Tsubulata_006168 [Turnera subulata]
MSYLSGPSISSVFDSASLCLITGTIVLSVLSLSFVVHLRFKSRHSRHLQSFNSLWTVRLLLVSFVILWAFNTLLRLPFFRQNYLQRFLPVMSIKQQSTFCKIHVVLSLGFLEPGFLVILLFLVNVSIKKRTPRWSWVLVFISATCIPILALQVLAVFFPRLQSHLPAVFRRDSVIFENGFEQTVLCAYPLMSCIIFGAFGAWYTVVFSVSCFKVVTLAINKGLRVRIYRLAFAVIVMLPMEIVFLIISVWWRPEEKLDRALVFLSFLCTTVITAVGQGILVIKPINDSLAAGETSLADDDDQEEHSHRRPGSMDDHYVHCET